MLAPLDAQWHNAALWNAVQGHDEVWTYLADGPYRSEADLAAALQEKQASSSAVFLAIVPKTTGEIAGYASYMRMDPAHGVIEVGNILLAPSLQRTIAATEAMYLMARHVFEDLGYRRYEWKCNANNQPRRRAAAAPGVHLRRHLPTAHGDQRPKPRHGLVLDARQRMARSQSRLRSLARPRQLRREWTATSLKQLSVALHSASPSSR